MAVHRVCWSIIVVVCLTSSTALGGCAVEDEDFETADGGCKDLATGLVFGSQTTPAEPDIHTWDRVRAENYCVELGESPLGEGYTDWRLPTVRELNTAIANGLNTHLDFFYAAGNQGVDSDYRFTGCTFVAKNTLRRWTYRYSDGDVLDNGGSFFANAICVRGVAPDYQNDCLDKKGNFPEEGPGKGGGKKKKNSQASALPMTALLFMPLAVVIAARWTRLRRQ
ncbi:MAG: hypothetical protein ACR2NM_01460 [Bythopirellula sp.]